MYWNIHEGWDWFLCTNLAQIDTFLVNIFYFYYIKLDILLINCSPTSRIDKSRKNLVQYIRCTQKYSGENTQNTFQMREYYSENYFGIDHNYEI